MYSNPCSFLYTIKSNIQQLFFFFFFFFFHTAGVFPKKKYFVLMSWFIKPELVLQQINSKDEMD